MTPDVIRGCSPGTIQSVAGLLSPKLTVDTVNSVVTAVVSSISDMPPMFLDLTSNSGIILQISQF